MSNELPRMRLRLLLRLLTMLYLRPVTGRNVMPAGAHTGGGHTSRVSRRRSGDSGRGGTPATAPPAREASLVAGP